MTYGGYEGFENEAIRQDTLRGRHFTKGDMGSRIRHNVNTSVPLGSRAGEVLPALPGIRQRGGVGGGVARGGRAAIAGEVTKYGTATKRFNVITGEPDSKSYSVCPVFNTYANRLPVHLLPKESLAVVMQGDNVDMRPSEPRRAGVDGNIFQRQYVNAEQALKPLGAAPLVPPRAEANEYSSLSLWKLDRTKHWRSPLSPQQRAPLPQTSAQEYGWSAYSRPNTGSATWRGRSCCRETRFAQSILLGARHKSGYGGQGTL